MTFGSSACVGELSNFLLGATFAFIAGIIYKKHKNRSGALWGSVAGAAAMEAGDNKKGIAYWEALLPQVEPGSEIDQMLRGGIDKMKQAQ